MKMIFLFLSVFLMSFSCEDPQPINGIVQIEFNTGDMSGYHEQILITRDSIRVTYEERRTNNPGKTYGKPLNRTEWNTLIQTVDQLSLTEISALESPTMARAYDGARHSEITLTAAGNEQVRHSFDNENPHEKLQPLMEAIRALANTIEKD